MDDRRAGTYPSSAKVAAGVDLLFGTVPTLSLGTGLVLRAADGYIGALIVESLALTAGCGSERVGAGDAITVSIGGNDADMLLPAHKLRWVDG